MNDTKVFAHCIGQKFVPRPITFGKILLYIQIIFRFSCSITVISIIIEIYENMHTKYSKTVCKNSFLFYVMGKVLPGGCVIDHSRPNFTGHYARLFSPEDMFPLCFL